MAAVRRRPTSVTDLVVVDEWTDPTAQETPS
jgi:hypothetical protein